MKNAICLWAGAGAGVRDPGSGIPDPGSRLYGNTDR